VSTCTRQKHTGRLTDHDGVRVARGADEAHLGLEHEALALLGRVAHADDALAQLPAGLGDGRDGRQHLDRLLAVHCVVV
jgi:hypothetical protein